MKKLLFFLLCVGLLSYPLVHAFPPTGSKPGFDSCTSTECTTTKSISSTSGGERISGTNSYIDFNDNGTNTIFLSGIVSGSTISKEANYQIAHNWKQILGANAIGIWSPSSNLPTTEPDLTVNARNGTYKGSPTTANVVYAGRAVSFNNDGTDSIQIADNDAFTFAAGTFSVAFWAYFPAAQTGSGNHSLVSKFDINGVGATVKLREWNIYVTDALPRQPQFYLIDKSVGAGPRIYKTNAMTAGWHFVVATCATCAGATADTGMKIYIDNVLLSGGEITAVAEATFVAMENTAAPVSIGSQTDYDDVSEYVPSNIFTGYSGVTVITDSTITATQVNDLYNSSRVYYGQ